MEEVKRVSLSTVLRLSGLETPVALYKTSGEGPDAPAFERAGPNGRPLHVTAVAAIEAAREAAGETVDPVGVGEKSPTKGKSGTGGGGATSKRRWYEEGEEPVAVADAEVRRGIRTEDGEFVDLTGDLEEIAEEVSLDGLEVSGFLRREVVPRERITGSYFLAPSAEVPEDAPDPHRLLRILYEAMKETGRVAIVRWTKRKGQSLGILTPHGSGALVVLELQWADRMRAPNTRCLSHLQAEVSRDEVDRASELISVLAEGRSSLDDLKDQREVMEAALAAEALETGKPPLVPVEPEMDAPGLSGLGVVLQKALAEASA